MGETSVPGQHTDEQITTLFAQDREKAFRMLTEKYSRRLYLYIRRMLVSHHDTDDVLQNTLVKAWENIGALKQSGALASWLYRIASNETMNFLTEKARRAHVPLDNLEIADEAAAEEAVVENDNLGALALNAIQTLPKVQQAVFTMRHFEGLKFNEISKILGTSEGALKASYHIALEKVRTYVRNRHNPN